MVDGGGDRADFVKRELGRTSIPEEYQVARVLAGAGFATQQGRAYMGSDGKPREIDVVGEVPPDLICDDTNEPIRVWLVAEVKHTDDHPWAVMDSGGRPSGFDVAASALASDAVRSSIRGVERRDVPDVPWFFHQTGRPVGHSLVVVGGREDAAYGALSQVVSAAKGLAWAGHELEVALLRAAAMADPGLRRWTYAWPILVISGELFVIDYMSGSPNVVATEAARVLWHGGPAGRATVVDVVRLSGLEEYAGRAFGALRSLRQRLYFNARSDARGA